MVEEGESACRNRTGGGWSLGAHSANGAQKCEQPCAAGCGGEVEQRRVAACEEGCFERVAGKRTAPPRFWCSNRWFASCGAACLIAPLWFLQPLLSDALLSRDTEREREEERERSQCQESAHTHSFSYLHATCLHVKKKKKKVGEKCGK